MDIHITTSPDAEFVVRMGLVFLLLIVVFAVAVLIHDNILCKGKDSDKKTHL